MNRSAAAATTFSRVCAPPPPLISHSYGRNRVDLERTLEWAAAGKLHPVIHRIFPLEETPRAFAALRDRAVLGKLVIRTAAR